MGKSRLFLQRLSYSEGFWGYLFLTPTILGLLLLNLGPALASGVISLTNWNIVSAPVWAGLANYERLLQERLFWKALGNTLRYIVLFVPLSMGVSLVLAMALNQKLRFESLFRTMYFAPSVSSTAALALVWIFIFDYNMGLLNWLLELVGLDRVPWLLRPATAMPALVIMSVWQGIGYPTVIWLAGLQAVPQAYYDACKVDGGGLWSRFRYVTWPLITPTAFFLVITSTIASFKVFQSSFVLTAGGPQRSTYTLVYYIYEQGFELYQMSYASAVAYVLFLLILVVTAIQWTAQNRWVHYGVG